MTTQELKNHLIKNSQKGLALDIDETLSWTLGYWIYELQKRFGNPENLTVRQIAEKYKNTRHIPYWQTDEAKEWMEKQRNNNELQTKLPLIENSNSIVQKINKIVPIVAYITTRPQTIILGTKDWLKKHNFPELPILARPKEFEHNDGNKWKAKALSKLYPEIIGIVDDQPELADELPKSYKGIIYLYDNIKHKRTDINIVPCKTWKNVYSKIKKNNTF